MAVSIPRFTVFVVTLLFVASADAMAQRSHSGHSHGSQNRGPSTTNIGTGSFGISQRWGTPAARGYQSPGNHSSSPDWTLRAPSGSTRTLTSGQIVIPRGPGSTYSRQSPGISYSSRRGGSVVYGGVGGPINYHNYGGYRTYGVSPIYSQPFYNGLSIQYSTGSGFLNAYGYGNGYYNGFPGVIAAPIVVPYGSYDSGPFFPQQPAPPQLILPPSPAAVAAEMAYDAGTASAAERQNGAVLSQPLQSDETPILNEFGDDYKAIPEQQISAVDRIKSLRYQTSGDQAFRQHDYESAEALYRAASDTAVVRRAPWLRLAWAQVALRKNSEALASLKTALHLRDDPTSSWVDGKDLFGVGFETNMVKLNEDLWKWLQAKPNSTDRLLLVAAFQQLRGYAGISQELTDAASRNGLDRELISALREISAANNVAGAGPNQPPVDQAPQPIDIPLPPVSSVDDGGIRMIGGRVISPAETSDAAIGAPEPVLASEEFPATQSEASSKNLGPLPQVSPGLPLVIPPMNSPTP